MTTNPNGIDVLEHAGLIYLAIETLPPAYEKYLPREDMVQVGWMALMRAAELFDPNLGFRWSTYAVTSVRRRVTQEVMRQGSLIRVPLSVGNQGDPAGWFEEAGKARTRRLVPEQRYAGHDGGERTEGNVPRSRDDPVEQASRRLAAEEVRGGLRRIGKRYRELLTMRFEGGMTLGEIAERWGVSRERVRQIEGKALAKLRGQLKDRRLL